MPPRYCASLDLPKLIHLPQGYSQWCELFTYEEWQGFEYSIDLQFNGNNGFGSPTGRAVGIGYVEELYARIQGHLPNVPAGTTQINTTMDGMTATFPLNQTLYFDFSHDTNIMSIITAFGLKQFAQELPATGPPDDQQLIVSHTTPFGARMVRFIPKKQEFQLTRTAGVGDHSHSSTPQGYPPNQPQCHRIRLLHQRQCDHLHPPDHQSTNGAFVQELHAMWRSR